jgi:hypothetical protein
MLEVAAMPARVLPQPKRFPWRRWLRSIHRDVGYLAVGMTVIYAGSGLAVNHIGQWDPNFTPWERSADLGRALVGPDVEVARIALAAVGVDETPKEVYRAAPEDVQIDLGDRTVHVDTTTGKVEGEGQQPRLFLRAANWLHLNRGKKVWTVFADAYAVLLLYLAVSGLFMLPGKNGLAGRGGILVLAGILVPVLFLVFGGAP